MNAFTGVSVGALSLALLAAPAAAQWVNYPTPGMPRTADGKPNLEAPAPRTADGKPDFSGLWERPLWRFYFNAAVELEPDAVQPWAQQLFEQRKLDFGKQGMEAQCLPFGPMYATTPFREMKIVQTPELLVMLFEDLTFRQIFMDGRTLERDPNPSWMGYYYCSENEKSLSHMLPVARPQVAAVSSEVLGRYVGSYELSSANGPSGRVAITLSDGKLFWNENQGGSGQYSHFRYTNLDEQVEGKRK